MNYKKYYKSSQVVQVFFWLSPLFYINNATPRPVGRQCPTGWNDGLYNCPVSLGNVRIYHYRDLCGASVAPFAPLGAISGPQTVAFKLQK